MRVTILGSGNTATVLGRRIHAGAHIIQQVFSPNPDHAAQLATELSASPVSSWTDVEHSADIYLVCVSDKILEDISQHITLNGKLVAHTAGSVSIEVLKDVSENYGVLYPLQTLRMELPESPYLPILIDANNPWNKTKLSAFAQSFADEVRFANDEERSRLHLAAVISNNFSNYLISLAEEYCEKEGIDFKLIIPLLEETARRVRYAPASQLQTGPAIRNDQNTMKKHLEMLKDYKELKEVYEWMSRRIADRQW